MSRWGRMLVASVAAGVLASVLGGAAQAEESDGGEQRIEAASTSSSWIPDGYYLVRYSQEIWYVDSAEDIAYALTYEEWAGDGFPTPQPAPTDFVKYPWSPSISAVTFFGQDRSQWLWDHVSFEEWTRAGRPAPRNAGWIEDSYFYQWSTSPEIFVTDAGNFTHKLTYAEWLGTLSAPFERLDNRGFVKLAWADRNHQYVYYADDMANGCYRTIDFATWTGAGQPTPQLATRLPGDAVFRHHREGYAGALAYGLNNSFFWLSADEWARMGSPAPLDSRPVQHRC